MMSDGAARKNIPQKVIHTVYGKDDPVSLSVRNKPAAKGLCHNKIDQTSIFICTNIKTTQWSNKL